MQEPRREDILKEISRLLSMLSTPEKEQIIRFVSAGDYAVPISCFQAPLSGLEIIVKYLKENAKLSFNVIAQKLNRNVQTIYTTYRVANKKFPQTLTETDQNIRIPLEIFQNRKFSILESLVMYLKDQEQLTIKEISSCLFRNYNTIKTVYYRYSVKKEV